MWHLQQFTFSPIQENTYLLWNDASQAVIIDPGCYHSYEEDALKDFIHENGLKPSLLINTHCHLDHVFGLKFVAETWGLTPHIHANEQQVLRLADAAGKMWGMPFDNYTGAVNMIKEGATISLGQETLQVLFAPGHSPGHLCFVGSQLQEADATHVIRHFVIGGDVLFRGSIGRTDLPGGNFEVLINSIRTQLFILPDDTVVFSGHGPATTIGHEKRTNPFLTA